MPMAWNGRTSELTLGACRGAFPGMRAGRFWSVLRYCLLGFVASVALAHAAPAPQAASSVLWYDQPARTWMTEALPLGNGSLGAMIFGLTDAERVQLNVNSLWTGNERDTGYYQAFGDLFIQLNHANPANYRRELDIARAVQHLSYESGGIRYERTSLISHPAKVMVMYLSANKPGGYTGAYGSQTCMGRRSQPRAIA